MALVKTIFIEWRGRVNTKIKKTSLNRSVVVLVGCGLLMFAGAVLAASTLTIGNMASSLYGTFSSLAKLITAGSYIAGLAFAIGAIMKFKQHKDNPTQVPIGTPIGLIFIAASLLFLPTILGVAGATMFGASGGKTAGPTGTIFS